MNNSSANHPNTPYAMIIIESGYTLYITRFVNMVEWLETELKRLKIKAKVEINEKQCHKSIMFYEFPLMSKRDAMMFRLGFSYDALLEKLIETDHMGDHKLTCQYLGDR